MKFFFLLLSFLVSSFAFENSVGVGIFYSKSIYIQNDDKKMILPVINYEDENFYLKGIEIGYKITPSVSLIVLPSLQNIHIENLPSKKETALAGFDYKYKIQKYGINFKIAKDIGQRHDGFISKLTLNHPFINYPYIFIPSIGIEYESKKVTNYYYGVPQNTPYNSYTSDDSVSGIAHLIGIYNINKNYALSGIVNHKFLSNQITNSPIIDSNSQTMAMINFLYKF